ncbi:hypothetical protein StoSoilB13_13760 [Arthrobacter sp. StoSoilB13]|nr:hypothetical protein StoSoilB13_13760 [Arthrobacter sp. StoSoilB13]
MAKSLNGNIGSLVLASWTRNNTIAATPARSGSHTWTLIHPIRPLFYEGVDGTT